MKLIEKHSRKKIREGDKAIKPLKASGEFTKDSLFSDPNPPIPKAIESRWNQIIKLSLVEDPA